MNASKKHPELLFEITLAARRDIADLLRYSRKEFGAAAAFRYDALIKQALRDIQADPVRPGVSQRPGLSDGIHLYHLAFSRDRVDGETVKTPRHFVVYRVTAVRVDVLRFLHDSRDLMRHLPVDER